MFPMSDPQNPSSPDGQERPQNPQIPQEAEAPQNPQAPQAPVETPEPQPAQPQVAAPPPHPFAAPAPQSAPQQPHQAPIPGGTQPSGRSGMLGIISMALGLLGLLTAFVTGIVFSGFIALYPGLVLGLAALALGGVALGLRMRPLYASIIGLVTGLLAIIAGIALFAAAFIFTSDSDRADGNGQSGTAEEAPSESAPDEAVVAQWPANLATGGIIFDETLEPVRSDPLADNALPEERTIAANDPADIQLFVDYRCPVCALFEATNQETLEEAVSSGEATLEVRPLRFLDRVDEADQYSSRASSAMMCVASEQPEGAWATNAHLLDQSVQPSESEAGLTNDELIEQLDAATGGLNDEARSCIASEQYVPFAQALDNWVFSTPVPRAENPALTVQGTPFAVVNGVPYEGSPGDGAQFRSFLEEQGISLD